MFYRATVDQERLPTLTSSTLADQAYEALRAAIITGDLSPREKITERGLAERLAVSPTPVREALRRLEQDHLIERLGPRTVQVADLHDDAAGEIRLVEATLRGLAVRLAATNATAEQLDRLDHLIEAGDETLKAIWLSMPEGATAQVADLAPLLQLAREFHLVLNEASNNLVLLRLLSLVDAFSMSHRLRRLDGELRLGPDSYEEMLRRYDEHKTILDAVRAGDGHRAEQLMLSHGVADSEHLH